MTELEKLKQRDSKTVEKLYLSNKSSFIFFATKYAVSHDDALDIYQDAFVALVENAAKGKLDNLQSGIKTYLFSIGKYMIFAKNKARKPETVDIDDWNGAEEWDVFEQKEEKIELLESALDKLGEQCYRILKMFYYENKKLEEMLKVLSYESKDVLKSQKARCLKQLRKMME